MSNGKMARGKFFHKNDIEAIGKWRSRFKNTDVYSSICLYAKLNNESDFVCPIFFDIDSDNDLAGARESALILCEMIMDRIGVPQDQLEIYFSGNKGFHVLVPCETFQAFNSVHTLSLYKRMAEKAEQAGVRFIDKGIYTKKRIWRLPNSINSKSGLYKIPLTYEELRDIDMPGILEFAKSARPEDSFVIPQVCNTAVQWYRRAIECIEYSTKNPSTTKKINNNFKKGWRMLPCVKAIEAAVIPDGFRHQLYLSLVRYYGYLNMHHDEMFERLEVIDKRNPIQDPDSIERAVRFGCEHPGFPGCDSVLKKYCQKEHCFYAQLKIT